MDRTPSSHPPHLLGRRGELLARHYLEARGWRVLERNYRFGRREIDLIVRRGILVAFVEVKTRAGAGYGSPEAAVTRLKQREIEIVAREYLYRRRLNDVDVRFDVVAVTVDARRARIEHIEDAWRPGPDLR